MRKCEAAVRQTATICRANCLSMLGRAALRTCLQRCNLKGRTRKTVERERDRCVKFPSLRQTKVKLVWTWLELSCVLYELITVWISNAAKKFPSGQEILSSRVGRFHTSVMKGEAGVARNIVSRTPSLLSCKTKRQRNTKGRLDEIVQQCQNFWAHVECGHFSWNVEMLLDLHLDSLSVLETSFVIPPPFPLSL